MQIFPSSQFTHWPYSFRLCRNPVCAGIIVGTRLSISRGDICTPHTCVASIWCMGFDHCTQAIRHPLLLRSPRRLLQWLLHLPRSPRRLPLRSPRRLPRSPRRLLLRSPRRLLQWFLHLLLLSELPAFILDDLATVFLYRWLGFFCRRFVLIAADTPEPPEPSSHC